VVAEGKKRANITLRQVEKLLGPARYSRSAADVTNIVLIGMPGCGKSTVGTMLGKKLGRELIDTDTVIVQMTGKSIPEIFAEHDEDYFRELETRAIMKAGSLSGVIIATGGGCVLYQRNYPHLRQNGRIYRLIRDLSRLPLYGRPLSTSYERLKEMEREREPYYWMLADISVDNNGENQHALETILRDFGKEGRR